MNGLPAGGGRLLTVDAVMEYSDENYYQLAVGTERGGPWRTDSLYLRVDDFELVEPPFKTALPLFVAHGVSILSGADVSELTTALRAFAQAVAPAVAPSAVYGPGAEHRPALSGFANWPEAAASIVAIARGIDAWITDKNLSEFGMSVIRQ